MGIFGQSDQSKVNKANTTVIAGGTKIRGEIHVECKLHVDGEFSGDVHSTSVITIGKTGLVEGVLTANKLVVTGRFIGTAVCDEVEILSGGRVVGQMESKVLVIERGSFFEGESKLKEESGGRKGEPLSAVGKESPEGGEQAGTPSATVTRLPEPVRLKTPPSQEAASAGS